MIPDAHVNRIGLEPVLFTLHGIPVTSYAAFMTLGVVAAILYYACTERASVPRHPHSWTILLSALFFGSLGAKLASVALNAPEFRTFGLTEFLYSGRSILGGLIGGWIGVRLVKKRLGITTRHGNAIAPAVALGIAIGRLGCFLASCCYGRPTTVPWAIDFGDGQLRHPTQLYESLFALALFVWLAHENRQHPPPGRLFRQFVVAYCGFRFLIEFLRVEPRCCLGLTAFQVLSLSLIAWVLGAAGWTALRRSSQVPAVDAVRAAPRSVSRY